MDELQILPSNMLQQAIEKGADISVIEKLMDCYERWLAIEKEKQYNISIAQWQLKKPTIKKTKEVKVVTKTKGVYIYFYAPLEETCKTIDPILGELGLSYSFNVTKEIGTTIVDDRNKGPVKMEIDMLKVSIIKTHVSGYREEFSMSAPADNSGGKNTIQSWGSTVSYLKRYLLEMAFGISTSDQDDDGKTAGTNPPVDTRKEVNEKKLMQILEAIASGRVSSIEEISKTFKLTDEQIEKCNEAIENFSQQSINQDT